MTADVADGNLVFLLNGPTKAGVIAAYSDALREIAPTIPLVLFADALRLVAVGVGLGAVGLLFASGPIRHMLYGVSVFDLSTLAATAGLLALVVLIATFWPARRAASVDPMQAMRAELTPLRHWPPDGGRGGAAGTNGCRKPKTRNATASTGAPPTDAGRNLHCRAASTAAEARGVAP